MIREELIKRSPLRILEKSIHGGIARGDVAVLASPKGVGKTACLVHIATDSLMQGRHVIHVSFSARTDHIISWYEDIFREIEKRQLESAMEIHDEIIRNRVILNFNQDGVRMSQIIKSLRAMIHEGNFAADLVVVDGFDFSRCSPPDLGEFVAFARDAGLAVWFSASIKPERSGVDSRGVPDILQPFLGMLNVLVTLEAGSRHVALRLIKDQNTYPSEALQIILDPRTLLIAEAD